MSDAGRLRDAEVGQLHVALERHEDVFRADVAVDDVEMAALAVAFGVRVGEAARDARRDEHGEIDGHGDPLPPVLLDELLEVHPAHELHDHVVLPADLPEVIGLDDVGVNEVRDQARLADEVVLEFLDGRVLLANELHRDHLAEVAGPELHRLVDHAHAPFRELAGHLIPQLTGDLLKCRHGWQQIARRAEWQGNITDSARNLL